MSAEHRVIDQREDYKQLSIRELRFTQLADVVDKLKLTMGIASGKFSKFAPPMLKHPVSNLLRTAYKDRGYLIKEYATSLIII